MFSSFRSFLSFFLCRTLETTQTLTTQSRQQKANRSRSSLLDTLTSSSERYVCVLRSALLYLFCKGVYIGITLSVCPSVRLSFCSCIWFCNSNISWTTLVMVLYYYEVECRAEKLVHCQGHSEGFYIKIWLFLLYLLNCWFVCNQTWFDSTAS